jgi:hypothetical protein
MHWRRPATRPRFKGCAPIPVIVEPATKPVEGADDHVYENSWLYYWLRALSRLQLNRLRRLCKTLMGSSEARRIEVSESSGPTPTASEASGGAGALSWRFRNCLSANVRKTLFIPSAADCGYTRYVTSKAGFPSSLIIVLENLSISGPDSRLHTDPLTAVPIWQAQVLGRRLCNVGWTGY